MWGVVGWEDISSGRMHECIAMGQNNLDTHVTIHDVMAMPDSEPLASYSRSLNEALQ